jgi:EAL domain-containing protein (putative c-di-GMP-specific phosphodiesterase class I)
LCGIYSILNRISRDQYQPSGAPCNKAPLAEESGLIHELGDWIFQEATREVARWRELFDPKFQVSVNVSPVQFRQNGKGHEPLWIRHLRREDLSGRSLIVEITEGVLVKAEMSVKENLLLLRKAGIQVALDDFGTGYSSLAHLKKFDIGYPKLIGLLCETWGWTLTIRHFLK